MWAIRKDVITLPTEELFRIVMNIESLPGTDSSELDLEDSEGCFEYISAFISSDLLLEAEDQGMSELLALQDTVRSAKQTRDVVHTSDVDAYTHITLVSHPHAMGVQGTPTQNTDRAEPVTRRGDITPPVDQTEPPKRVVHDFALPMGRLSCVQPREFKVQGSQIGDHSSDITYNNVCRQIDSGRRENFSEADIVRVVLLVSND